MKLFLLSIIILFSSCATKQFVNEYIAPVDGNTFQLSDKNNFFAAGSIHPPRKDGNHPLQYNFQLGYSPIKHLGIVTSYNHYRFSEDKPDHLSSIKLFNIALGGYYSLQDEEKLDNDEFENTLIQGFLINAYAGYSNGKTDNKYPYEFGANSSLNFHKYYVQGGVLWQNELLGLSLQGRIGEINFYEGGLSTEDFLK